MSITVDNRQPTGNELFRFVNVRDPRITKASTKKLSNISWKQSVVIQNNIDTYITDLISHSQNPNKEEALQQIMQDISSFKSSANYYKSMGDLEADFENVFLTNEDIAELTDDKLTFNDINNILDAHLSTERTAIGISEILPQEIKLWENIIAEIISPENVYVRTASISLLKTYHLLRIFSQVDADKKLATKNAIQDAINARVVLPSSIFPLPQISNNTPISKTEQQKFIEKQKLIADARETLTVEWHSYHNALLLLDRKTDCYHSQIQANIKNVNEQYEKAVEDYNAAYLLYEEELKAYNLAIANDPNYNGPIPVEPKFDDGKIKPIKYNFDELAFDKEEDISFINTIKKVICIDSKIGKEESNTLIYIPISKTRNALLDKLKELSGKIATTLKPYDLMIPIGNSLVKLKSNYVPDDFIDDTTSSGGIQPGYTILGVGDLLKVEQEILCYEAGEVAHIENVMKGEYKDRSTRDLTHMEQTTITEEETITEEKRDLETTDRSEMNKESSTIINNDFSIDQGVLISGKFGPVKVDSNTNVSVNQSSSTQNSSAVNFSKSVTERASNRVQKRIRKETRITIIKEFEEINKHGFENRAIENGPEVNHIVGIYRWVNKIYRNTLWNYGKRMMLEFMVPEPSAYHIYAKANSSVGGIKKPIDPKDHGILITTTTTDSKGHTTTQTEEIALTSPDILTEQNYIFFAAAYDADVAPPPTDTITIGKSFSENPTGTVQKWDEKMGSFKYEIPIPEGYYCNQYKGNYTHVFSYQSTGGPTPSSSSVLANTDNYNFTVPWGRFIARDGVIVSPNQPPYNSREGSTFMSNIGLNVESVFPISLSTFNVGGFTINFLINCKLKASALDKWRLATYNAIMQAYYQQVSEYEQKLSRLQIISGVQIQGSNPLQYQTIINNELKKACIELMANENFDKSTANFLQTEGYDKDFKYTADPTLNIGNAVNKAPVIRFFEHAFEWDQMTYIFYPYFWANRNRWIDLYNLDDNDPLFANFLKAGAARVIVPVRPGFEAAVAYFNQFYQIPQSIGEFVPDDPNYLSIAAELKPNYDREFVDSWDNVLPTNLVILQKDATGLDATGLPCWRDETEGDGIGNMFIVK